ncbi:unnamed protein product [Amoebophrya sp. A25]|nr:unnamed protein product [Amoebophrya sp. A25]|eukprot:GSA25T00007935001.1
MDIDSGPGMRYGGDRNAAGRSQGRDSVKRGREDTSRGPRDDRLKRQKSLMGVEPVGAPSTSTGNIIGAGGLLVGGSSSASSSSGATTTLYSAMKMTERTRYQQDATNPNSTRNTPRGSYTRGFPASPQRLSAGGGGPGQHSTTSSSGANYRSNITYSSSTSSTTSGLQHGPQVVGLYNSNHHQQMNRGGGGTYNRYGGGGRMSSSLMPGRASMALGGASRGNQGSGGSSGFPIGSIWDVCKAVEDCQLESSNFAIDALAVPAVLGPRGFQLIARSFGLSKIQAGWKTSRLGQRRPTLISFCPSGSASATPGTSSTSTSTSGSGGVRCLIYEKEGSGTKREVSEEELEKFIGLENERCGERILLSNPVRVEIISPEVEAEVQILDLPEQNPASTSAAMNVIQTFSSSQAQAQSSQVPAGRANYGSGRHRSESQLSSAAEAWPGWVKKMCRGKPIVLEKPADGCNHEPGAEYFILPGAALEYDPAQHPTSGEGDQGAGAGDAVMSDSLALPVGSVVGAGEPVVVSDHDGKMDVDHEIAASHAGQIFRPTCRVKFLSARANLVSFLLGYHEKTFCNRVAPQWSKMLQRKLGDLDTVHKQVLELDRDLESTVILARNAGASVAACSTFLLDGSIRQNYCQQNLFIGRGGGCGFASESTSTSSTSSKNMLAAASKKQTSYSKLWAAPAQQSSAVTGLNSSSSSGPSCSSSKSNAIVVGETLGTELAEFAKDDPEATLPDKRFGSWAELGKYYETVGKPHFFDQEVSGGAALARLLKECEASVMFATAALPNTMQEVLAYLKKEVTQSGGVVGGNSSTTWQDVVTKIFKACTHQVLQDQALYVRRRLNWFLRRQKDSVLAWMRSLQNSADATWYSRLYTQHGDLLAQRQEIRRAVFRVYDEAIEEECTAFEKIVQQMLSAIYNKPNAFLAKNDLRESETDEVEEFSQYVLNYIAEAEGKMCYLPPERKIVLRLDKSCTLKINRQIVVDLTRKKRRTQYSCIVGRNPSLVTEHIDDMRVSSTHFAIQVHEGRMVLADMSSNGTFIQRHSGLISKVGKDTSTEIHIGERIGVLQGPQIPEAEHVWYTVDEWRASQFPGANGGTEAENLQPVGTAVPDPMNTTRLNDGNPSAALGQQDVNMGGDPSSIGADVSMVAAENFEVPNVIKQRPQVLEKDRGKRLRAAMIRVREEMSVNRRSVEVTKRLDRRFDTQEVDTYLPHAARHILNAFHSVKRWVASHVTLFAHAFLIRPLSNRLREAMSRLTMAASDEASEEQLWKEHARMLLDIETKQDRIHDAMDRLMMQQRHLLWQMRRGG